MGKSSGTTRASSPRNSYIETADFADLQMLPQLEKRIYKAVEKDVLTALNKASGNTINGKDLDNLKSKLIDKYKLLEKDLRRLLHGLNSDTNNAINFHDNFGQNIILLNNLKQRELNERKNKK